MLDYLCECFPFWKNNQDEEAYALDLNIPNPNDALNAVCLDIEKAGQDVVIVKSGKRLCGTGAAISNVPIIQNKAYFEVKVQAGGVWGIGLATSKANLSHCPLGVDKESWVLRQDSCVHANNEQRVQTGRQVDEGDIIGVAYDHEVLSFFLNGDDLEVAFTGIRGTVFPVIYVDEGAILDIQFSSFSHQPPPGFSQILLEKTIL